MPFSAGDTLTAAFMNDLIITVSGNLSDADTAGGILTWQNPEGQAIYVVRLWFHTTTKSTGACTADFGSAGATVVSVNDLIDGINVADVAKIVDNMDSAQRGSNGRTMRWVGSNHYITGSTASGSASGLVGVYYIQYVLAG